MQAQVLTPFRELISNVENQEHFLTDLKFNIGVDTATISKLDGPFLLDTTGLKFYLNKKRGYGTKGRNSWNIEETAFSWTAIEVHTKRKVLVTIRVPKNIKEWVAKEGKYVLVWGTAPKAGIIPLVADQSNRRLHPSVTENFHASSKDEIVMTFGIATNSTKVIKLPKKVDQFFANYAFAATTHKLKSTHRLMDYRQFAYKDNQVYLPEFEKLNFNPDATIARPDSAAVAMENAVKNASMEHKTLVYSYIAS